jgi:phosphoribosylanthranilate isomerase
VTGIKICGITNKEDALFAASCGTDALGFIFYPPSPRYISPEKARTIIDCLPPEVVKVGVFVNQDAKEVERIRQYCGLDLMQLHGDETPDYCRRFEPSLLIKALSLQNDAELDALGRYEVRAVLVDARDKGLYGGTGLKSNWDLAVKVKKAHSLILSGGLKEENINEAIASVFPQAVDINSGIESAPGKKDHGKLRNVIELIRNIDDTNCHSHETCPRAGGERKSGIFKIHPT